MGRAKSPKKFIKKNITLPADYESRLKLLREYTGSVSDSDVIQQALLKLESVMEASGFKSTKGRST